MASDTAGPSAQVTPEEIQKAIESYERGVQHLRVSSCSASLRKCCVPVLWGAAILLGSIYLSCT